MAYRKLYIGDLVRVVDVNSILHGMDVVVIDAQLNYARVQVYNEKSTCYNVDNKNLLVRHSAYDFIVDGRVDHDARYQHDEDLRSAFNERNIVDTEQECPYDSWDREDLIEKIKDLEAEIEKHNVCK